MHRSASGEARPTTRSWFSRTPTTASCRRSRSLCNLIVVTGGVWQYRRSGALRLTFALPFVALSIPMAWFGGTVPIQRETFVMLLGLSLLAAGLAMWFQPAESKASPPGSPVVNWFVGLPVGGAIGFLAGMVGIGGGIFLAPCSAPCSASQTQSASPPHRASSSWSTRSRGSSAKR